MGEPRDGVSTLQMFITYTVGDIGTSVAVNFLVVIA